MAGLLISGPAGGGKSALARQILLETGQGLIVDFQSIYASMLLLNRLPDGRYPEREAQHDFLLPLAEYTRRAMISGAVTRGLYIIATNSDGDLGRRLALLDLIGGDERIVDPGIEVVRQRLTINGTFSDQCQQAINRWYMRL